MKWIKRSNSQSFSLPGLEWCALPAGKATITYHTYIEHGPRAGEEYDTERVFDVSPCLFSRYSITNDQYQVFVDDPDGYANRYWWRFHEQAIEQRNIIPYPPHIPQGDSPRTNVSWWDARAFCRWLSAKTGQTISLPKEEAWVLAAQTPPPGFERPDPTVWEWCLGDEALPYDLPSCCLRKDTTTRRRSIGLASFSNLGFRVCRIEHPAAEIPAADLLDKLYHETNHTQQWILLGQLARRGIVECVPYLITLTQQSDDTLRFWALCYLGLLGDMRATETLIHMLDYPDPTPNQAAAALGNLADPKAVPALIKCLHSDDLHLRGTTMRALLRIGLPEVFEALLELAQNEQNPDIRRQVISALSEFRHTPAIEHARSQLEMIVNTTEDEALRAAVLHCLDTQQAAFVNPHGFVS